MCKRITQHSEKLRNAILQTFKNNSQLTFNQVYESISKKFDLKQGCIRKHLNALVEQDAIRPIKEKGKTYYSIRSIEEASFVLKTSDYLDEMEIWVKQVDPILPKLSKGAKEILEYCFSEILNNAINHANAKEIRIVLFTNVLSTGIIIRDNGIGIFRKIKDDLNLKDEHQSLLELSKGKFTSDPKNHSGEGIFFSSRACNSFIILSGNLMYTLSGEDNPGLLSDIGENNLEQGTIVYFSINSNSSRSLNKVFTKYSPKEEDNSFCKTVVPVKLLRYKDEGIVSRSQAKRLLSRFEKFKYVVLDFEGIEYIGQAFADEIFRVFKNNNRNIELTYINANQNIKNMISHVTTG